MDNRNCFIVITTPRSNLTMNQLLDELGRQDLPYANCFMASLPGYRPPIQSGAQGKLEFDYCGDCLPVSINTLEFFRGVSSSSEQPVVILSANDLFVDTETFDLNSLTLWLFNKLAGIHEKTLPAVIVVAENADEVPYAGDGQSGDTENEAKAQRFWEDHPKVKDQILFCMAGTAEEIVATLKSFFFDVCHPDDMIIEEMIGEPQQF